MPQKTMSAANHDGPEAVRPSKTTKEADVARKEEQIKKLLCMVSGMTSVRLAMRILSQIAKMQAGEQNTSDRAEVWSTAIDTMSELKPASAWEAMLAAQMVSVHEAALMFLHRATLESQTLEGCEGDAMRATRLMRLFTEQLVAMARLKGKAGQQRVRVEHVHVHQGGQAIVGAVNAGKNGPEDKAR